MIKIGDYIRWWMGDGKNRKSYAGTVTEEHPGWNYYFTVACIDGKTRHFSLTTVKGEDGAVKYEPEYINWSEGMR